MDTENPPTGLDGVVPAPLWAALERAGLTEADRADLDRHPDQALDLLLDAAEHPDRTGDGERPRHLLEAVREHAPEPAVRRYAPYSPADLLRRDGEPHRAGALVDSLLRDRHPAPGPAHLLAEEFEEAGEHDKALHCYNLACRHLLAGPAEQAAGAHPFDLMPLRGRARMRERPGPAPDGHDRVALTAPDDRDTAEGPDAPFVPEVVRPVFSRDSLAAAQDARLLRAGEAAHHHTTAERELREAKRAHPDARLFTLLADPAEISPLARAHPDLDCDDLLEEWAEEVTPADSPRLSPWPPGRNEPCWCGSTRKYKKCCGTPALP
ncbi:hypothetical protein SUDANB121_01213 [Nocardiopsis dassonvillei]|uniref:SEC-C metal-binding domain-containing protein n=1 Tax=Nocardiopsis dassonvillei TaxID=2014 RepID=UPI003F545388